MSSNNRIQAPVARPFPDNSWRVDQPLFSMPEEPGKGHFPVAPLPSAQAELRSSEYFEAVRRFVENSTNPILLAMPGGGVLNVFEKQRPTLLSGAGGNVIDYVVEDARVALLGTLALAYATGAEQIATLRAELIEGPWNRVRVRCIPLTGIGAFPIALLIWDRLALEESSPADDIIGGIEKESRRVQRELQEKVRLQLDDLRQAASELGRVLQEKGEVSTAERANSIATRLKDLLQPTASSEFDEGLIPALRLLAAVTEERFQVRCSVKAEEIPTPICRAATHHLHRIAQEAVSNAIRHGGATQIRIGWRLVGEDFQLTIEDNGCGFPQPRDFTKDSPGTGLQRIKLHARQIDAVLEIHSTSPGGTSITCKLKIGQALRS